MVRTDEIECLQRRQVPKHISLGLWCLTLTEKIPWQHKHPRFLGAWSWGSPESILIFKDVKAEVNGHKRVLNYLTADLSSWNMYKCIWMHSYRRPVSSHSFNFLSTFEHLLPASQILPEPGRTPLLLWIMMSVSLLTTSIYAYAGDHAQWLLLHNLLLCEATYRSVLLHDLCPCSTRTVSWGWALRNNLAASSNQGSFYTTPCENFSQTMVYQKKRANKLHIQNKVCHLTNLQREPSVWNRI